MTSIRPAKLGRLALAVALVVGTACTDNNDRRDEAGSTTSTTEQVVPTEAAFQVPDERFDEIEAAGLTFTEVDYPSQPDDLPWPTEQWAMGELPEGVNPDDVDAAVKQAFGEHSDDTGTIEAILAVHRGELVVEEYNDWDPTAPHNSWSMAKSITNALVGVLVGQGKLDIWEPVGAAEWSEPDDPRAAITMDQLLRMSSGLQWNEDYADPSGDVLTTLGTGIDRAHFTASKPLEHDPGTVWNYSTGTANLVARSIAAQVGYGDELVSWAYEALFGPLGIANVEHSVDEAGVISGGSWMNMTAQDFARFGLLFLRDGVWDGERLLPEGWVDYSRMPNPARVTGRRGPFDYGAHWWLDRERPGTFQALGFAGQSITIVPEHDLVLVVLSDVPDDRFLTVRNDLLDAFSSVP